ncbi:hypothetical protein Back11_30870 [Paenibacillus baekrokdamisoli]|uniref:Uncharacterized protein n=1 Tax=Paenibacillus baekrokdamisoli TaxID=1712516 RepID=A0A3G9IU19_9BACL|nr:hypothetical protein [Paenibacillus baekrokdamisoli]MBB3071749.1 hypothetical protein [Paenibacillus baekrokdamisoli]BBH21742.1 hypothetical protein Back11_30870 [Paenibacillus baekrokdamisoli]
MDNFIEIGRREGKKLLGIALALALIFEGLPAFANYLDSLH